MIHPKEFKKIFLSLREMLGKIPDSIIEEINGIKIYANKEGTYFTAKFDKKEYTFHFRDDTIDNDIEIPEREELLIIDAFEDLYELLYKRVNAEEVRYEKVVDRLFEAFLKRRKKTPTKKYLEISRLTSKVYI